MIPIQALKDLIVALPNSYITEPVYDNIETGNTEPNFCSWIFDRNEERVGSINWKDNTITIFESYEYAAEVMESIGSDLFERNISHFDAENDMPDARTRKTR